MTGGTYGPDFDPYGDVEREARHDYYDDPPEPDRPSPSELAEDERETCAGCDRPVYRDEARRLPDGAYVCGECPVDEP